MANGLNLIFLMGNLGGDPELRVTQGGTSKLTLNLATTDSYLDKNRVRQERTEWHRVVIWGRRAEALSKFLAKGAKVFIEGKLTHRSYDDRDGNKRYITEVVAKNVIVGGSNNPRSKPRDPASRASRDDHYGEGGDGGDTGHDDQEYGGGSGDSSGGSDDDIPF